jgi:hypothetical protein
VKPTKRCVGSHPAVPSSDLKAQALTIIPLTNKGTPKALTLSALSTGLRTKRIIKGSWQTANINTAKADKGEPHSNSKMATAHCATNMNVQA